MRSEWPIARIADIASNISIGPFGSRMKSDCYVPSGVPVIRGTNLTGGKIFSGDWVFVSKETADSLGNCCVVSGDLVFPHRGAIGEVGIVTDDFPRYVMSSSLMKLTCDLTKADPLYTYYFFKSKQGKHELLKNASQVGTPGIGQPLTSLKGIEIPLPPINTQYAIARILNDLDDKIELNRHINQTLEQMAQATFKSWFVDFEPVKSKIDAKAEGRDPERAAMCVISGKSESKLEQLADEQRQQLAATVALFPDEFEESELGLIPKFWEYRKADEISDIGIGKTPPRKEPQWFTEDSKDVRWVSIRDMGHSGAFMQDTAEYLTTEAVSRFNVRIVPDHTVLLSFKLTVGRVVITDGDMVTNEAIAHFKLAKDSMVTSEYLYLLLKQFDYASLGSTSSIADAVNSRTIREMPILVPTTLLLAKFTETISPLFTMIRERQSESVALENLRDTLLPKLLQGGDD